MKGDVALLPKRVRMITNQESTTNVHEIADEIHRINTPIARRTRWATVTNCRSASTS